MSRARIDRIALVVPDIAAAAADLKELFDIDLHIHDVAAMGARVGMCDEGFELVQPLGAAPDRSTLAVIGLKVDDLDDARRRMSERGHEPSSEIQSPGRLRELVYATGFAGLPLALAEYGEGGFATESGADREGPFEPRWISGGPQGRGAHSD
jgi:hypothetical protein